MSIAITTIGPDLDSAIDPRLGRAAHFLIVEDDDRVEAIANPQVAAGGGAGIQSAQMLIERGVSHVLTGDCGPNAYRTLTAGGVAVVTGCSGRAADALARFRAGHARADTQASVSSHHGMG
ncbi:MAG: NifB/NifX family molybdenum-iron cluster-binding protein [Planctomycetota bacterium]